MLSIFKSKPGGGTDAPGQTPERYMAVAESVKERIANCKCYGHWRKNNAELKFRVILQLVATLQAGHQQSTSRLYNLATFYFTSQFVFARKYFLSELLNSPY